MKLFPVPSAIDGRKWIFGESPQACVDLRGAKMIVPTGDSPTDRMSRIHELGHAKITPQLHAGNAAKKAGVSFAALQCAEDYRVNLFLKNNRLFPAGDWIGAHQREVLRAAPMTVRDIALYELCTCMFGDIEYSAPPGVVENIRNTLHAILQMAREGIGTTLPPSRIRRSMAVKAGFKAFTVQLAKLFDQYFPEGVEMRGGPSRVPVSSSPGSVKWLEPIVSTAPMTACRTVVRARGPRASDCGTVPRFMGRYCADGSIFGIKRRAPGGTVLIDGSGSMRWNEESLIRCMKASPGMTVAVYSDWNLLVVGKDGRLADWGWIEPRLSGGNGCDGRALDWLLSQPAPRVWVTDYGVTDANSNHTEKAVDECRSRVARGSVRVVPNAESI